VQAGKRDCPQDNQRSKGARRFNLSLKLALFLYVVVVRFIRSVVH